MMRISETLCDTCGVVVIMSSNKGVINIKSIDGNTARRSIVIRLIRFWIQKDRSGKEGVELILLDEQGDKIQASIPASLKAKLITLLKEGRFFTITNFQVVENQPTLQKAKINHQWKLIFGFATRITEYNDNIHIDENGFQFIPFRDVCMHDINFVLDVMGEVKAHGDIEFISQAKAKKCDVLLADAEGTELTCVLWEGYADQFKQFMENKAKDDVEPVMLVLQFVVISTYRGVTRVTTMKHSTRFFICPDFPEIKDFIIRRSVAPPYSVLTDASNSSRHTSSDEWLNPASARTFAQIINSTEAGTFITKAKIVDVNADEAWYYEACGNTNCFKGVEQGKRVGDMCKKCHSPIGSIVIRFKIKIVVMDSAGQAHFTLFDNTAPYFLHKSATELITELDENGDKGGMPDSFVKFLDRECLFMIEISERFNIELKKHIYTVKKVTEDVDLMTRFLCTSPVDDGASQLNCGEDIISDGQYKSEEAFSEKIDESSSNSTTPLKRMLEFSDDDMQHSAVKVSKTTT